jgi:hypothetical protein
MRDTGRELVGDGHGHLEEDSTTVVVAVAVAARTMKSTGLSCSIRILAW